MEHDTESGGPTPSDSTPATHARMTPDAPSIDSSRMGEVTLSGARSDIEQRDEVFEVRGLSVTYGGSLALEGVDLTIHKNTVTAFIGPSGCGKSTFIRCFNRMNDLIPIARVSGSVKYHGKDLYEREVDPVEVRRRIGMVFQKPNPFPKSIYDNVAFGPRVARLEGRPRRPRRGVPAQGGALGRGQGPAQGLRDGALRRPAAAALHRPGARHASPTSC